MSSRPTWATQTLYKTKINTKSLTFCKQVGVPGQFHDSLRESRSPPNFSCLKALL